MNMMTNPSDSDVDRRRAEELEQANAVLEQWMDLRSGAPLWSDAAPLTDQARRTDTNGLNPVKWTSDQRRKLAKACFDDFVETQEGWKVVPNRYKLGAVQLDVGDREGRPGFFWTPGIPVIIITSLDTRSPRFVAGEREAMAVVYVTDQSRQRVDRKTGIEWDVMDDRRFDGLLGPCRYFPTFVRADEALTELRRAVATCQRWMSNSAERRDPVQSVTISDFTADPDVF